MKTLTKEEIWNSLSDDAKQYLEYVVTHMPQKWIESMTDYLEGERFIHTNGNIYTVLYLTNTQSKPERWKDHPIDVVYQGANGNVWSRPLSDWFRSFTKIK